jgi:ParB-like chromosome segregation protein Spo0J
MARASAVEAAYEAREVGRLPIGELKPNPRNAQRHTDDQINRLMASLRRDGQTRPVVARRANKMLIAGHGIREAASRLGFEQLEVVLLDVSQADADRMMVGDNRLGQLSSTDEEKLADLLREFDPDDMASIGFTGEEAAKALQKAEAHDLVVHEVETSALEDRFWIGLRGPLREQAVVLDRVKLLMREMPGIEIKLGTTDDL